MTGAAINASVVICTYTEDRWFDLRGAVESVQNQSVPPSEIIVVIDHNSSLLDRVHSHLPGVKAVENREPPGLSGARNSGIAVAKGELIAFLDDDATAEPDWLIRLARCCEDPQVLGAGGKVEPMWLDGHPAWFPEEFYWVIGCSFRGMPEQIAQVRNPFGGCMCVKRAVFDGVGGFRSGIGRLGTVPLGCEETELCIRARQRWPDKVFLYEPRAKIHHRVTAGRAQWSYFRTRCYGEGLSKALLARLVGMGDGLAVERAFTLHTLPQGMLRDIRDTLIRRDLAGLARAGLIAAGLAITTMGYLAGTIYGYFASPKSS